MRKRWRILLVQMHLVSLAAKRGHREYAMVQGKQSFVPNPVGRAEVLRFGAPTDPRRMLDQIVRDRARQMLQAALEDEVNAFLEAHSSKTDGNGRRQVVRNGYVPTREIVTGAGCVEIKQPRVRDKSPDAENRVTFSSSILPPYLIRSLRSTTSLPNTGSTCERPIRSNRRSLRSVFGTAERRAAGHARQAW